MLSDRRAKICATLGPASNSRDMIRQLLQAGVNIFRLNFSHGSHEDHTKSLERIRSVSEELMAPVAILQDLQGPKIRIGKLLSGPVEVKAGDRVILSSKPKSKSEIPVDFAGITEASDVGTKIFIDDGLIELLVVEKKDHCIACQVVNGGTIKDRKGVNIPGANLPVEALTSEDYADLEFGLENGVDYVALSFVRQADDIKKLATYISSKKSKARIIAKIEMLEAVENLDSILEVSDGAMVARGDLAVEVGQSHLPAIQKRIIHLCNQLEKPVITATQMLESMVENPRPTRAEITDVANAILDGSDGLMLSAETAVGKHPKKCVETMAEIIQAVEETGHYFYQNRKEASHLSVTESIAASASLTAEKLQAKAIICLTSSGETARIISSFRPKAKIIAATQSTTTLNALELVWGVQTVAVPEFKSSDEAVDVLEKILIQYGLAGKDDPIIITMGMPAMGRGMTNSLRVSLIDHDMPRPWESEQLPLRFKN